MEKESRRVSARSIGSGRAKPRRAYKSAKPSRAEQPRRGSNTGRGSAPRAPQRRGPKRHRHRILKWTLGIIAAIILAGIGMFAYLYATTEIPLPEKIAMAEKTKVYYADGTTPVGNFATQNREIISCDALPKYIGQSMVASENQSFYKDTGVDFKGIARALLNNVSGGARQGASTITQQYAERYYMGDTHTYSGKVREAILAMKITKSQDKDKVLCNYMNTIYLGRGAYGIEAASKAYFNKDAKDMTMPESALLAGIIPAPSTWDPAVNPKRAQQRFTRVINIMKNQGYISAQDAAATQQMPPTVPPQTQQSSYKGTNGYILQMVRDELTGSGNFTPDDLDTGGYTIVTTIDKDKQDLMFNTVSPSTDENKKILNDGMQTGGMSVNPKDGSIISFYAGDDYLTKQLNNATQATYEPGSTMKPFALLATIQAGVSLNTTFNGNSPRTYAGITQPVRNFGNEQYGYTNLYNATANSVNTVYMDLQEHLGAKKVAQTAQAAGMNPKLMTGDNPFTVLGNDGVHVSDIAQAYSTIANQGNKPTLHIVASVKDSAGKDMYRAPTGSERIFSANDTALVAKAMTGTVQYGTATEVRRVGKPIAGKTGTANDSTAGSFIGFTPSVVTVIAMWKPGADGKPQEIKALGRYGSGGLYPAHLFTEYMKQTLADTDSESFPVAHDEGKVGGPDGSWGTGARYSSSSNGNYSRRSTEGNDSNSNSSSGSGSTGSTGTDSSNGTSRSNETGGTSSNGNSSNGTSGGTGTTTEGNTTSGNATTTPPANQTPSQGNNGQSQPQTQTGQ
ncbi:transglycosylase domain-containing protein [Bifidobacterium sp. ESL0745]|uniref:transglycosylase domain-containing protein n=1 Tax=Bifidobacterium sp. ESL0745 TaxID=2983226 RepID=UPI0023F929F5|nr:transglycosylase domain-containing protein [Bifidobacterium sp. ESL0745]MDF7664544.1 transglycosylase domain-containing protein [Bifidobacterium sp. ESL0745]